MPAPPKSTRDFRTWPPKADAPPRPARGFYQRERVWLWPARKLTPKEADRIREIPGTEVWKEGWVCVPPDAAFAVVPALREMGIRFRGKPPPPITPLTAAELKPRIADLAELQPLIDGREPWSFLYPFQKQTIARLLAPAADGGLLISPVGSGKTIMALIWGLSSETRPSREAMFSGSEQDLPPGILLLTKSSVRYQIAEETRRFTRLDPFICRPAPLTKKDAALREPLTVYLQRQAALKQRAMIIAPWESLGDHYEAIMQSGALAGAYGGGRWSIILDEVTLGRASERGKYDSFVDDYGIEHLVFTPNVARATLASFLRKECDRALAMTGTPVANRLKDVWGIVDLARPGIFGPTVKRFGLRYMGAFQGEFGTVYPKGAAGRTNLPELQARMASIAVWVPASIVQKQLPPKIRRLTSIPVEQQELRGWGLREIAREVQNLAKKSLRETAMRGGEIDYDGLDENGRKAMDRINELLIQEAAARKAPFALDKIVEFLEHGQGKRKVLGFVGRQRLCDKLGEALVAKTKAIPGVQVWWVHGGSTKPKQGRKKDAGASPSEAETESLREEIRKAYMAHPGPCVLITTYQAMGMGSNLQDTDYMPVIQPPMTPEELEQLEGRGARLGQERPLLVELFKALKTIDERIFALILDKLPAVEAIAGESTTLNGLIATLKRTEGREERMRELAKSFGGWFKNVQSEPEVAAPEEEWPR